MPPSINFANTRHVERTERTPLIDSANNNNQQQQQHLAEAAALVNKSTVQSGVSWGVAAFLLVNTALGAGMLNYPYAYNQIGGVLAAALTQVVLLVFIASTMFILVYCADINQDDSYHDVLMSMCGKRAQQISAFSIFLTCYGINVTFLVIIGDQYDRIFNSLLSNQLDEFWYLDRKFTIFITAVLFIWPMCYAKRLDFLRHASILGLFAMLYVAFLTIYEHYKLDEATINAIIQNGGGESQNKPAHPKPSPENTSFAAKTILWFEPLAIVPVLCFAYQTHEVIVPVYACMQQRSIGHFMKASIFGLVILFLLYNIVGAFGYLTFGSRVGADIMSLYDAKDPVVVVGIVALVIKFITTYPPLMFCGRGALDGLYGEFRKLSPLEFKANERIRRIIISTLWFFSTVLLAVFAPDISVTLQLLGSMASINVFVFPGMCLVSLTRRLRRARMALLIDDFDHSQSYHTYRQRTALQQQRAKDYYLISGRDFSAMRRNQDLRATAVENNYNHHLSETSKQQHFGATFADLLELEKQNSSNPNNNNHHHHHHHKGFNGFANHDQYQQLTSSQRRQEEFERLISNGGFAYQDRQSHHHHHHHHHHNHHHSDNQCASIGTYSNGFPTLHDDGDDLNVDFGDSDNDQCDQYQNQHHQIQCRCDMISPIFNSNNNSTAPNNGYGGPGDSIGMMGACSFAGASGTEKISDFNNAPSTINNKTELSLDRSAGFINDRSNNRQILQNNSWNNNKSTTVSILDRLGSSIAPSTVAQIGISKCTAISLYLFSAIIIIFGTFIFVLELVTVSGFLY